MNKKLNVSPMDKYNKELINNVHPQDWKDPVPREKYNLVVIGAGTAGLISAIGTAGLGGKAALIEKNLMGGDCLNVGCVPSKSLIKSSRIIKNILSSDEHGIKIDPKNIQINFDKLMERVRKIRAGISHHDSAARYQAEGVDVFIGEGKFLDKNTVEVNGKKIKFKKAVIATGARASKLNIPGLEEAGYLNNETVFNLTKLPESIGVIGGGPIGCELSQALNRLGSQVYLFHNNPHILDREDKDAAEIIQNKFINEGVKLFLNVKILKIEKKNNKKIFHYEIEGKKGIQEVNEILVGAGRTPNIEGLNLDKVGVKYDKLLGIKVNDKLQTANKRIFAAGDVCMKYKFTHAAESAAKIVIQNSLFFGNKKLSTLTIPWCTYTEPEIAHVGLYEHEAEKKGIKIDTYIKEMKDVDRAIAEGETEGFVKIHVKKGTDKIIGATIVASHAGDLISELSVAMAAKMGLGGLYYVIHPYPTQADAIRQAAGGYMRTKLSPGIKKLFRILLKMQR